MYPFFRVFKAHRLGRSLPKMDLFEPLVTEHRIWPSDIDIWMELNNGRTLTLYDLSRLQLLIRVGLGPSKEYKDWFLTIAGSSVRYRRRVLPMSKVKMRTAIVGHDDRFFYVDQSMWMGDTCANQGLVRFAIARRNIGIQSPAKVIEMLGHKGAIPQLPEWVQAWIDAEATRPWPPQSP